MGSRWGEDISSVEGRAGGLQLVSRIRKMNDAARCPFSYDKTQHSIVWSYEIVSLGFDKQRQACAADPRIHHYDMDCSAWKVWRSLTQDQRRSHDVLCRYAVTQIYNLSLWINPVNYTLHDPHKGVCVAEIGGERYEHRITRTR